jgi:hypothetical protein
MSPAGQGVVRNSKVSSTTHAITGSAG